MRSVVIEDESKGLEYKNEFNEVYPFKDIRRVIVESKTGNILHFCSEETTMVNINGELTNYNRNTQEVMTYFPAFYYKRTWDGSIHYDSILDLTPGDVADEIDGYKVHPAFIRPDGTVRPYVLVGCFMGTTSITNNNNEWESDLGSVRDKIWNLRGRVDDRRFQVMNIQCHMMLILLQWITLQDRNVRNILGGGQYNTRFSTEDELDMGHRIGNYKNTYNNTRSSFYGITRYWQSTTHAIDGIIIKNKNQLFICEDYSKVDDYDSYKFVEELDLDLLGKTYYTFGELFEMKNESYNWINFPKNQSNGFGGCQCSIQDTENIQVLKTSYRSLEGRGSIMNVRFDTSHRDNETGSGYQTSSYVCFLP